MQKKPFNRVMQRGSSVLRSTWSRRHALKRVVEQNVLPIQIRGSAAMKSSAHPAISIQVRAYYLGRWFLYTDRVCKLVVRVPMGES